LLGFLEMMVGLVGQKQLLEATSNF